MTLFSYRALSERGKIIQGVVQAETLREAKQKLVRSQILVVSVEHLPEKQEGIHLDKKTVLSFTRELACLLRAGLSLYEALSMLEEKYSHQSRKLLLDLCDCIRSGQSFSLALGRHPQSFDLLYRSLIANAERTGSLTAALEELSRLLEKQLQMQKQLLSALLYPSLLGGFCFIVLITLLYFVIPSLFELFEGKTLHPFTRFVFSCSHFALWAKWPLAFLVSACGGGFAWLGLSVRGRKKGKAFLLQLPGLHHLWIKVALVRFFRATAILLDGGVPLVAALQQAREILGHPLLEAIFEKTRQQIERGESLQAALQQHSAIPTLVTRMLGVAQEGGNLAQMMQQIAAIYEDDLEKKFSQITTLAQPLLLLLLGGMIGFVLLSVLLPMTDVSSFVL